MPILVRYLEKTNKIEFNFISHNSLIHNALINNLKAQNIQYRELGVTLTVNVDQFTSTDNLEEIAFKGFIQVLYTSRLMNDDRLGNAKSFAYILQAPQDEKETERQFNYESSRTDKPYVHEELQRELAALRVSSKDLLNEHYSIPAPSGRCTIL